MIRNEARESNPSRRAPSASEQKPPRQPNWLKRLFGAGVAGKARPATKCTKVQRGSVVEDQEMLLV